MAAVLAAFQDEQAEHCQTITQLLLDLEQHPAAEHKELLDQLFREAHSLKGGARAAGQPEVEQIAHAMEDLFSAVRQGRLALTPDTCDPIYAALHEIGAVMAQVGAKAPIDSAAAAAVVARLEAVVSAQADALPVVASSPAPAAAPASTAPPEHSDSAAPAPKADSLSVRVSIATLDTLLNETGELLAYTVRAQQRKQQVQEFGALPMRWRRTAHQVRPIIGKLQSLVETVQPTVHYLEGRQGFGSNSSHSPLGSRLSEHDLQALVEAFVQADTLISELERRLKAHLLETSEDHARLAAVTDRLHDQIRRTRMLPLATILNPLRLQVRDMVRSADKQAYIIIDDGGAEADRQVLDALRDVLLHMVRNAVDHGIEPPAERTAQGKPAEGQIKVLSRVNNDRLNLVIEDDGAGIDTAAIRHKAQALGLHSEAELHALSTSEVLDLIFLPGLSTSAVVNNLSGRGVGLDIVRTQLQRIQGHISIHSVAGQGTRFELSVPLSLTSAQSLLLQVGAEQYVVPLDAVQRIIAVEPEQMCVIEGQPSIIYQGRPTLLVQLAAVLNAGTTPTPSKLRVGQAALVVVLGTHERQVACQVDAVLGQHELVIHRLPEPLRRVRYISSATIMADGAVVPILDVVDVIRGALGLSHTFVAEVEPAPSQRRCRVLVVDDSLTTRTLQKNILEAAGYSVAQAVDGQEALEMLRTLLADGGCDVVLSDIDMPRLNGFELTSQIRADERMEHLPIILVTSLDTAADRERGIAAGADAYIVKRNFDQRVLLDTIKQLT